jgi:hypothetical protein
MLFQRVTYFILGLALASTRKSPFSAGDEQVGPTRR